MKLKYKDDSFLVVNFDDEDYSKIEDYNWWIQDADGGNKYVMSNVRGLDGEVVALAMHRVIMGVSESNIFIDHINGNGLDNRKSNLRTCTQAENSRNRKKSNSRDYTSKFKGVIWRERDSKWRATIHHEGRNITIGNFESETDCAKAYDVFARKYYGEFARANFPNVFEDESFVERVKFRKKKTKYNGVYFIKDRNKWSAKVTIDGKLKSIGNFKDEVECAKAYDLYLINNGLPLDKLNFKNRGILND